MFGVAKNIIEMFDLVAHKEFLVLIKIKLTSKVPYTINNLILLNIFMEHFFIAAVILFMISFHI